MWDNHGVFELSAGQIVADKYRIDGVMGTGGMGVVVAATHVELDQRVAIKFLREVSPEALARFQREARLLVRLKSPHVARVFDVGALEDDTPYIVMEHLDGSDLSAVIASRGRLPLEETVDYIVQAMEAVAEAHALGMVHRDLKPANLFLAKGPGGTTTVKVLDFGVSKILDDRGATGNDGPRGGDLTNEGVALGSPGYMSPEQMTSARDVDERSDIFSIGALLYRLVSGQNAYKGSSVVSILASMATEPLTPLKNLVSDVPEAFGDVVQRCLAHDKAARFPTLAHLAHALVPYATRRARVSIEQILATLSITFPDDGLADTVVKTAVLPSARSSRPGAKPSGPAPAPQFTVSAPASVPPSFPRAPSSTPGRPSSQRATIGITLAALALFGAAAAWRATVARTHEDPASSATTPASGELSAGPKSTVETASPFVASSPSSPASASPPEQAPSAAPLAAETSLQKPRPVSPIRPRPHPSVPAHGPGPAGPSPPPNPADVPGGRH